MVALGGATFAGFLFGFSALVTLLERVARAQPRPMTIRADRGMRAHPRLWA
jgi:hypothetical protein